MAAGVVAAVYLLGAIVVALRLWVARLPGMSVIGGLPRESLVAVGLAQVLGIALGFAAILAGILFSIDPAKPRDHHRRFNEKTRRGKARHLLEAILLVAVLLVPAVLAGRSGDITVPRAGRDVVRIVVIGLTLAWVLLYLHVRARVAERFTKDWRDERRVLLSAGLVGVLLLPALVAFWGAQPLEPALACAGEPVETHAGVLVGDTGRRLFLGEPAKPGKDKDRILVGLPSDEVHELHVGSDALEQRCTGHSAIPPPVISQAAARIWHGRVVLRFRLDREAHMTVRVTHGSTGRPLPRRRYNVKLAASDDQGRVARPVSLHVP